MALLAVPGKSPMACGFQPATVCRWAADLGVEPAGVEMLMFALATSSRSSQWSQPELLEGAPPPDVAAGVFDPDAHEVLDAPNHDPAQVR